MYIFYILLDLICKCFVSGLMLSPLTAAWILEFVFRGQSNLLDIVPIKNILGVASECFYFL